MRRRFFYLIAVFLIEACSPAKHATTIAFPCEWPGSPGFTPQANWDKQNIIEPSGMCFHPQ